MTSNKVINAEQKKPQNYERCTYVRRLLKRTNMHTQRCTDVTVTNSDSQTSKKRKLLVKNTD